MEIPGEIRIFCAGSIVHTSPARLPCPMNPTAYFLKPCRAVFSSTNIQFSIAGLLTGLALLFTGCAGLTGPNGLGQFVLVVCKLAPDQKVAAQNRANQYFSQVASGKSARPLHRYVAVQTLDPNPKQRMKYLQTKATVQKKAESSGKSLGPEWAEPSQLHCIVVFDAVTHDSVGTDCYVVSSLPRLGEVSTYDTFPAEFVANSKEVVQ